MADWPASPRHAVQRRLSRLDRATGPRLPLNPRGHPVIPDCRPSPRVNVHAGDDRRGDLVQPALCIPFQVEVAGVLFAPRVVIPSAPLLTHGATSQPSGVAALAFFSALEYDRASTKIAWSNSLGTREVSNTSNTHIISPTIQS